MLEIKRNISLKKYSTFKIGGPAKYFVSAKNNSQLMEALFFAFKKKIPIFILGKGSNTLFADEGYKGLVIKLELKNYKVKPNRIICGAGLSLNKVVDLTIKEGFTGLEWAAGIPGTVGGAIFGNAGSFGKEMRNVVESVKVLNLNNFEIEEFKNKDCQFSYRSSLFKRRKEYIIIETELRFKKGNKREIKKQVLENLLYKKEHYPLKFPSVGSIFKNVKLTNKNSKLIKKFQDLKQFKDTREIPTAYLIQSCDLKGKKIGGAQISKKHSNFIINVNKARAKDVMMLINLIKQKVKNKFQINLEEEIIFI